MTIKSCNISFFLVNMNGKTIITTRWEITTETRFEIGIVSWPCQIPWTLFNRSWKFLSYSKPTLCYIHNWLSFAPPPPPPPPPPPHESVTCNLQHSKYTRIGQKYEALLSPNCGISAWFLSMSAWFLLWSPQVALHLVIRNQATVAGQKTSKLAWASHAVPFGKLTIPDQYSLCRHQQSISIINGKSQAWCETSTGGYHVCRMVKVASASYHRPPIWSCTPTFTPLPREPSGPPFTNMV